MNRIPLLASASIALLAGLTGASLAAPDVVASIKPVHSLVAAVMDGVGEPQLLVKGGASPHTYSLKPSDAEALQKADLVFWTGHGMETFLVGALGSLSSQARIVELAETPDLITYPVREGGAFEPHDHGEEHADHANHDHEHEHDEHADADHDHDHDHADHEDGPFDMHFWLDPENAKLMVREIAKDLSALDPDNAATYAANADKQVQDLDALEREVGATLAPVADKPFIVFHDAFQYFEKRFDLTIAGSITVNPEIMPGAQRIGALKAKVAELGATCVFAEPQFKPSVVNAIVEGTPAKTGVLDPEAGNLTEGPGLYAALLRELSQSLVDCLDK